jgi:type I restriction enzyme S subunit
MKSVILSVKEEFALKIYSGEKLVEFRRSWDPKIEFCWIYTGHDVRKITGCFFVSNATHHPPETIWQKYEEIGGIDKDRFFNYFAGKDYGWAIRIMAAHRFSVPVDPYRLYQFGGPLQDHPGFNADGTFKPPVSYYNCPPVLDEYLTGVLKKEGAAAKMGRVS